MSTYATAVAAIARTAVVAVELGNYTPKDAILFAAAQFVDTGRAARTRTGVYAFETKTETLEDAFFHAGVAHDVIDGDVSRPSVGNVRQAALDELTKLIG
jgi:hypothetical protein